MATSQLRSTREQELLAATRALFDERGLQDAPIDEIARTVGIALRTPNRRASYDALETTPRTAVPPTTTGLPRRDGSLSTSTPA